MSSARPAVPRLPVRIRTPDWVQLRSRLDPSYALVAALGLAFIAISVWWISQDTRLPDGDNAKHLSIAFGYLDELKAGHLRQPFMDWNQYPPLVHLVGAVAALIFGARLETFWIAENVVFVPLLLAGCYGAGRIVGGPRAGVLACVFALASPMLMSLFHVFMLDGPEAALVAMSVWLLLASERFGRPWVSAAAGFFVAAGMYAKGTYLLFVCGLLVVMFIRGGWRNWRGLALFAGVAIALTAPWYISHYHDLRGQTKGALGSGTVYWYGAHPYPSRWSLSNYTWYGWNLVNNQLYLPLTLFFAGGLAWAGVRWARLQRARSRSAEALAQWRSSHLPELLVGAISSYIGISLIALDDPRYTMPSMVYMAVLGCAWVVSLRRRVWRTAATVALVATLVVNTYLIDVGSHRKHGFDVMIHLPGYTQSPIDQGALRVFSDAGFVVNHPDTAGVRGDWIGLLRRAHDDGARKVIFQPESLNNGGYNLFQLSLLARAADLQTLAPWQTALLGARDIYMVRQLPSQVKTHKPCLLSWDKTGIYMFRGQPAPGKPLYCPPPS